MHLIDRLTSPFSDPYSNVLMIDGDKERHLFPLCCFSPSSSSTFYFFPFCLPAFCSFFLFQVLFWSSGWSMFSYLSQSSSSSSSFRGVWGRKVHQLSEYYMFSSALWCRRNISGICKLDSRASARSTILLMQQRDVIAITLFPCHILRTAIMRCNATFSASACSGALRKLWSANPSSTSIGQRTQRELSVTALEVVFCRPHTHLSVLHCRTLFKYFSFQNCRATCECVALGNPCQLFLQTLNNRASRVVPLRLLGNVRSFADFE